jgi:hypothetical protein
VTAAVEPGPEVKVRYPNASAFPLNIVFVPSVTTWKPPGVKSPTRYLINIVLVEPVTVHVL